MLTNPKAAEEVALITESLAVTTRTLLPVPFSPLPLNHTKKTSQIHFTPFRKHQSGVTARGFPKGHIFIQKGRQTVQPVPEKKRLTLEL